MRTWQQSLTIAAIAFGSGACEGSKETADTPHDKQEHSIEKSGELTEIRVIKSHSTGGDVIETHHRSDDSIALEVSYRNERPIQIRAFSQRGVAQWECEIGKTPKCILRDERGAPLGESEVSRRSLAARQRLARARELLAPEAEHEVGDHDHGHDKEHGKNHGPHINVPPPSEKQKKAWDEKRANAWAHAGPWFARIDQLLAAEFPILVATTLAKEELSTGFSVTPAKKPLEIPDCH
ncbi:MAG: hypothetical protein A2289_24570 [Deltaproteobacteria bacterium RIFOXYA12_FULL_58_15]|nr:MAG: hypothetical protein A2289_24570 [Deltaproteobacteria bacterium RIFOXYA12_FULL_58_15]OGR12717.1 MAG: hypothetical protein A2341_07850 [Deltaproteobacteria bacterium RIFOXYB12_FULL_58_9]